MLLKKFRDTAMFSLSANKSNILLEILLPCSFIGILNLLAPTLSIGAEFQDYDQVAASRLPDDVLWFIIARNGRSKNYEDLIALDGGTVGIAHFAVGGLEQLYANMDTQKYFSKSQQIMRSNYAAGCRPPGRKGNDTGWGCFSQQWWHQGMRNFLRSRDSKKIQRRAWLQLMKPAINEALNHDWRSDRELAIAISIANSKGTTGLTRLANKHEWDAEKTLEEYGAYSEHTKRRKQALDEMFPLNKPH